MKSYEGSKWHVKIWRKRWYFIIPFIFLKMNLFKEKTIDILIEGVGRNDRKRLINSWFAIKKHVELTKLHKYS